MSSDAVLKRLARAGFDLAAPLAASDYNALVPEVWQTDSFGGVWIVASAGRTLWPRFRAAPEFGRAEDPLDTYTRRCFEQARAEGQDFALYHHQREGQYLPLIGLSEAAGIGTPGRVGVLLHREFGPWLSLRGLLFVPDRLRTNRTEPFDPCTDCPAPCESACPVGVVSASGVDVTSCYEARLAREDCAVRCDARAACVIGPEHAFVPEQVAHHSKIRQRG